MICALRLLEPDSASIACCNVQLADYTGTPSHTHRGRAPAPFEMKPPRFHESPASCSVPGRRLCSVGFASGTGASHRSANRPRDLSEWNTPITRCSHLLTLFINVLPVSPRILSSLPPQHHPVYPSSLCLSKLLLPSARRVRMSSTPSISSGSPLTSLSIAKVR